MSSVRRGVAWRTLRFAVPACLAVLALALFAASSQLGAYARSPYPLAPTVPFHPVLAQHGPADVDLAGVVPAPVPEEGTFRRGETLGRVLRELGLTPAEAHSAVSALSEHLDVRHIRAGDPYAALRRAGSDELAGLEIPVRGRGRVSLARSADGWVSSWQAYERRRTPRRVEGTVDGSLIAAVVDAGAEPLLAYRMADVLQWDVDFSRDLRAGDRFEVAFDEVELGGELAALEIQALVLDNDGRRLEAYRFGGDYYDGEGRPLQKMFLRSPLRYSFVTSRFSHSRFHPVLKTYRPHWGVDYRARPGTPVHATASGVVTFAGWSRGGGKMVKIRHPNNYLTAYLHLSRFASGVAPGRRVKQGDVVAYSGNTGLSTAPHLDYRVQKSGRWIDPLKIDNVPAEPIPEERRGEYLEWRDVCRTALELDVPLPAHPEEPPGADARVAAAPADTGSAPAVSAGR